MGYYVLTYVCVAVFVLASVRLVYRQWTLPLHVRWEIYPVRHETAARVAYGGSYMEEVDWWNRERERSLANELKYMVPEIFFLRGLWKANRGLWLASFPFHFGLYLMIATFGGLLLHASLTLWGSPVYAGGGLLRSLLDGYVVAAGWLGLILGCLGGLALMTKRLFDREWREYSSLSDYFNLGIILAFFLSALAAALVVDPWFTGAKGFVFGLLTGGHAPPRTALGALTVILASLLVALIPLTHMSHMFMKYFLYHQVKWDEAPNRRGGKIEAAVRKNLDLKPTWQAAHVRADGCASWKDIASSTPGETK